MFTVDVKQQNKQTGKIGIFSVLNSYLVLSRNLGDGFKQRHYLKIKLCCLRPVFTVQVSSNTNRTLAISNDPKRLQLCDFIAYFNGAEKPIKPSSDRSVSFRENTRVDP